jgi:ribosome-associated toxin RatA of RatAB toxin-antitoxin module
MILTKGLINMQNINKEKIVPYSAANMYSLVADIEKYPDFVPYCTNSEIISSFDSHVEASIEISYLGISKRLVTKNTITPNSQITMALVEGPIDMLCGCWSFIHINNTISKVSLEIELSDSNKSLRMILPGLLDKASSQIMSSFIARAKKLYG